MSGITDQEHATDLISVGQSGIHVVGRRPKHGLNANVVAPGALGHHG
jgi:hypothetical protein